MNKGIETLFLRGLHRNLSSKRRFCFILDVLLRSFSTETKIVEITTATNPLQTILERGGAGRVNKSIELHRTYNVANQIHLNKNNIPLL